MSVPRWALLTGGDARSFYVGCACVMCVYICIFIIIIISMIVYIYIYIYIVCCDAVGARMRVASRCLYSVLHYLVYATTTDILVPLLQK